MGELPQLRHRQGYGDQLVLLPISERKLEAYTGVHWNTVQAAVHCC